MASGLVESPKTLLEFLDTFSTEEKCREYLFNLRWPEGFRCPTCGGSAAWRKGWRRIECPACHAETSLTAGTVLHKTRTPLRVWFWAAFLFSRSKQGISANELARQADIRQETAWLLLHKLRRPLDPSRPLAGLVEVDEALVGGVEEGRASGRRHDEKALVAVAVEAREGHAGRAKLQVIDEASEKILTAFVQMAVLKLPTTKVKTDGWGGYNGLSRAGFRHLAIPEGDPRNGSRLFPNVHRVISNLKSWLQGTFRSVSRRYLPLYLNEFNFRFNRRWDEAAIFGRLLLRAVRHPTITLPELQVQYGG